MIIVDTALKARQADDKLIQVGIIGAGFIGNGVTKQIENYTSGMRVAAISNRTLKKAENAYQNANVNPIYTAKTPNQVDDAIKKSKYCITDNPYLLCEAEGIDVIIEATGEVEFGAKVVMQAIKYNKHVVLMNAELDATIGPILKVYADKAKVILTNADGDQPGVMMNLFRFVDSIGYRPVLAGNIKGLQDHYRTPDTQKDFAEKHNLSPIMATSFADGTKISMENAIVANATGFKVGKRGMYGPGCKHVNEAVNLFPLDKMLETGLIDYILGAEPGPGVFVLGYNDDIERRNYMKYFKMGDGPLYPFYTPYHLPHLEVHLTAARAVLFKDAAVAPLGGPVCDVITVAKRDLKAGEILDGIGGFMSYGEIENYDQTSKKGYLPMGLSEGCRIKNDIPKDETIKYQDVKLPEGRICDLLRKEQSLFFKKKKLS